MIIFFIIFFVYIFVVFNHNREITGNDREGEVGIDQGITSGSRVPRFMVGPL